MKIDNPLVSVIVPTYNSAATLERCLESIEAQTYPNIEIIVVDNFSDDETYKIAAKTARVIQAGPERSAQINAGAREARGTYLYRVDGDMVLESTVIQACVETIQSQGLDAIAVPNRSQGEGFWQRVRTLERDTYLDDPLIVAARFWKRSVFEAVGGMDEGLFAWEDYDLHNRLLEAGYRFGRVTPVEFHLGEATNLWAYATQSFYYGPSVARYMLKHPGRGVKQLSPLRTSYLRHWRMLANQPMLTAGLFVLKLVQYMAAASGVAADFLGLLAVRGRLSHQALAGLVLVLISLWSLISALPNAGLDIGNTGSWLVIALGLVAWQLTSRKRAKQSGNALYSSLLGVSLAFSPLLLILVTRPTPGNIVAWEIWRDLILLMSAVSISWLFYLSEPMFSSFAERIFENKWIKRIVHAGLLIAVALFVTLISLTGLRLLSTFSLSPYDLAVVDQALWASWNGGLSGSLSTLLTSSIYERSIFAYDAAPALLLLLPAYSIGIGGPPLLLISQSLALGLGAIALFRLATHHVGRLPSVMIAAAYLLFFLTARMAVGRFYMLTWSIPLLLFALDAYHRERMFRYYLLLVLALACGVDVALVVVGWGLYLILVTRERAHGLIALVLGATWFSLVTMAFIPFFGGSLGDVFGLTLTLTDEPFIPWVIKRLISQDVGLYLWGLTMPTGFMPLLGAPLLLPALPRLLINLIGESPALTSLSGRFEIVILPFLFLAAVRGLDWLGIRCRQRDLASPQLAGSLLILLASVFTGLIKGPDLLAILKYQYSAQETIVLETGHHIINQINPQASVAAQSPFAIHLAHRNQLSILPRAQDPDFILFDVFHPNREPEPAAYHESLTRAFSNPLYGMRTSEFGYLLFERGLDPATKFEAIATDKLPEIQYVHRVVLDNTITYLGFDLLTTNVRAGERVYLTHYWQSLRWTPIPYLQFTAYPGDRRFEGIAFGLLPPNEWGPGDVVKHHQIISLPLLPDGDHYEIAVGLWFDEGEPTLLSPDQLLGKDVIRIATISTQNGYYKIHPIVSPDGEESP
jgi:glycosyltransferase involved in cell wall biosynthesis/uncharacterized membrane protein